MYLTFTFKISDVKNDDGQGMARRRCEDKFRKGRQTAGRLSNRKQAILSAAAAIFSQAYQRLVQWGMANWNQLPFTFPLTGKDGKPVLDKNGEQKQGLTSAHYLANWLSARVDLSDLDLHSRLSNGARNQAAETFLSQYQLRQMEESQPRRLTGKVGKVKERIFDRIQLADSFSQTVDRLREPETTTEELAELSEKLRAGLEPRFLPVLFPGPADFPLFRHRKSERLFVCLPLLSRNSEKRGLPPGTVIRNGRQFRFPDQLVPLREETVNIPNSFQWVVLPLVHQRLLPNQRNAEEMLAAPEVKPRSAELRFRDGSWYFNIVVKMPELELMKPEAFLGVHIGYYALYWTLVNRSGQFLNKGRIDQSHLKNAIEEASRQRSYARARMRVDRFPRYRGFLKLEREKALGQIIALAKEHQAGVGVEDISGVEKSTWLGRVNLLRSHWDFGKDLDFLTYKSVLAGLPVVRRGKRRELFRLSSFRSTFTCSACWFTNAGKPEEEQLVALEDEEIFCGNCEQKTNRDENAARVVAAETQKFFQKRK